MKFQFKILSCFRCKGGHVEWWNTTRAPSCDERVKRNAPPTQGWLDASRP